MAKKKSDSEIISKLGTLKQAGLINLDMRKVTSKSVNDKKQRRSFLSTLRKFGEALGFIEETTTTAEGDKALGKLVKIKDDEAREALESRGHRTHKSGLVFIAGKENETIKVSPKGNITYSRPVKNKKTKKEMIEVIYEPNINLKDINTVEEAVKVYAELYAKQKSNTQFAFTYYGNLSRETFATVEEAMLKVISYIQDQNDINTSLNPGDVSEVMKAVQLLTYIEADPTTKPNKVINEIKENKREFNSYFKKLNKKRAKADAK